jgi:SAM-dependent methyltransferase
MTIPALREFMGRHLAAAHGLSALTAALDARAAGEPLDPALASRIEELLAALGSPNLLENVTAEQARGLLPELRHQLADTKLLYAETRAPGWQSTDPRFLQDVGDFARCHAAAVSNLVVPALDGMVDRLSRKGAAFLDVGVGVAGLAIAFAERWPEVRIVGIDVWQPALALARANVETAGLGDRIELRGQSIEELGDEGVFDLAWLPLSFFQERIIGFAMERVHRALRPGGRLLVQHIDCTDVDPLSAAAVRLRVTSFGGPLWDRAKLEGLVASAGFEVMPLPKPPGVPVAITVGTKK